MRSVLATSLLLGLPNPLPAQVTLQWEVGALDGAEHEIWQRIEDAAIVGDNVLVVDIAQSVARVFDLEGTFLRTAGGQGAGPGEFARPSDIRVVAGNAYISDFAQGRVVTFDDALRHVETRGELYLPLPGLRAVAPLAHGWRFGIAGVVASSTEEAFLGRAVLWNEEGSADTLATFSVNHIRVTHGDNDTDVRSAWRSTGPDESWVVIGPDRLASLTAPNHLRVFSVGGSGLQLQGEVELPGRVRRVLESEVEAWLEWRVERYGEPISVPGYGRPSYHFPESWNPWAGMKSDGGSGVWLLQSDMGSLESAMGRQEWVHFDLEGRELNRFSVGPGVDVLSFRDHRFLAVREDEFGVQYLQLYTIGD